MATALTAGYIYFIINKAGHLWIHDPENIDLDNYIEGVDYCKITIPEGWTKNCNTGIVVTDVGGGKSFDLKYGKRSYSMTIMGEETTASNADKMDQFSMQDNTTIAGTSFTRYYLVVKYATNNYEKFTDSTNTRREYCKGVITPKITIKFSQKSNLNRKVSFGWRSVW